MTRTWMAVVAATAMGVIQAEAAFTNGADKLSYSIGVDIGRGLKRQEVPVRAEPLAQGIRDALAGSALQMTDEEMRASLNALQAEMMEKQAQARQARDAGAAMRSKAGVDFLEANKKKEGVVTLPSGLQYKIIKAGEGVKPTEANSVECHYRGTLIDGKEFDSSYKRGQPAVFPVTGVIAGWTEALKLMPVGSTWELYIPASLAYGTRGAGEDIGPNETLIFKLELLGIK